MAIKIDRITSPNSVLSLLCPRPARCPKSAFFEYFWQLKQKTEQEKEVTENWNVKPVTLDLIFFFIDVCP